MHPPCRLHSTPHAWISGDIFTGTAAAAGICAALTSRARTGKGKIVETSLLATGVWANVSRTYPQLLLSRLDPLLFLTLR